ncbi:CRISPR-associated endoribonuclease Cas2 [Clostridium liquoris]|jgi:CRISPR-associated protein Cas2|uniref:CRISPR-associated endoribonuclease Cas2 n=1 Tax=Clostridium liquoris TaxID=1289519 RepID=A0A2T0B770_9CLOT|nr:CRISPR-associated endonuclease Cas2 [Clostridium liquoris]PRR79705.1 CRISPR-associated endoribonuclease Cas2 [Clostridium liquoris]
MLVWVVYDITDNKIRNRIVKFCKNKGLYRVQKSVFLGTLDKNEKDELKIMVQDTIDKITDSVYIFPSSKEFLNDTDLIGQGFDKELISDELISKFI